jgi:nucleoside-diphosphate-sugar epimerase
MADERVCVVGGSRYFGKRLIRRLLDSGARVTVVNRGSGAAPAGAEHLVADRDDERALAAALGERTFDVVIDQVCYTPRQAEIARRVLGPRTRRYVMTSTVEVYEYEDSVTPVREAVVDPRGVEVEVSRPWDAPGYPEEHYGEGKRQAEAVFAREPAMEWASVRVAHVLGGADDPTGRVAYHAERIRAGEPVPVAAGNQPATYVYVEEIADFLCWAARQEFRGAVNACSADPLGTGEICAVIGRLTGTAPVFEEVAVGAVSPFSFRRRYAMDNTRAAELGYRFTPATQWLERALAETLAGAGARR